MLDSCVHVVQMRNTATAAFAVGKNDAGASIGEIEMPRPNVTLQPSKRVVTLAAAQIYAAYIAAGWIQKEEDVTAWMDRSIREAIAIARTVDVSVQSDEELPDEAKPRLRDWPEEPVVLPKVEPRN